LNSIAVKRAAAQLLLAAEWKFARTMPDNPHWYTLRETWSDDASFISLVALIRKHGTVEVFKKRKYTVLRINEFKYWTMGAPISETILINKAMIAKDERADYDAISECYDEAFADKDSKEEELRLYSEPELSCLVDRDSTKSLLDIGCGTCEALSYLRIRAERYVGIDPSGGMLDIARDKYPDIANQLCQAQFEDFIGITPDFPPFDFILSTFGSMNYIKPEALGNIRSFCHAGTDVFLMFYVDSYYPVTYKRLDVEFPFHKTSEYDLSGFALRPFGDSYIIATRRGL